MKQLKESEFLDLFDPEVHDKILASAARYPDCEGIVCFESADGRVREELYKLLDIYSDKPKPKAKLVLAKFWKGETFEQLGENHDEPGQGHFHVSEPLKKWFAQGGFDTFEAYCDAYREVQRTL